MIARTQAVARWLGFAAALWILGTVIWGLVVGKPQIEAPMLAVWLFIGLALAHLMLWALSKAVRPK